MKNISSNLFDFWLINSRIVPILKQNTLTTDFATADNSNYFFCGKSSVPSPIIS